MPEINAVRGRGVKTKARKHLRIVNLGANIRRPALKAMWLIAERDLLETRVRAERSFWDGASDEEQMITKFVERSMRMNEHVCALADEHDVMLLRVTGAESSADIADRIESLLLPEGWSYQHGGAPRRHPLG